MAVADPDWTDPCAVLAWLRPQVYKVAVGLQVVTLRHGDTTTTFSQANKADLTALLRQLESECAAAQGLTTRRRAFIGG